MILTLNKQDQETMICLPELALTELLHCFGRSTGDNELSQFQVSYTLSRECNFSLNVKGDAFERTMAGRGQAFYNSYLLLSHVRK